MVTNSCRKNGRSAEECRVIPGCRFVHAGSSDFNKLKRSFVRKCQDLGDFGCRQQDDCEFKCSRLAQFDNVCKRRRRNIKK